MTNRVAVLSGSEVPGAGAIVALSRAWAAAPSAVAVRPLREAAARLSTAEIEAQRRDDITAAIIHAT